MNQEAEVLNIIDKDIQMTDTYVKTCSTCPVVQEIKIQVMASYYLVFIKLETINKYI